MNDDEKRGYAKGYAAGRKRKNKARAAESRQRVIDANWNRAYLAVLPVAMASEGWTVGGQPVNTTEERVKLARLWANQAVASMRINP